MLCCVKVNVTSVQKTKGKQGLKYDMLHLTMEAFTTHTAMQGFNGLLANDAAVCWQMLAKGPVFNSGRLAN